MRARAASFTHARHGKVVRAAPCARDRVATRKLHSGIVKSHVGIAAIPGASALTDARPAAPDAQAPGIGAGSALIGAHDAGTCEADARAEAAGALIEASSPALAARPAETEEHGAGIHKGGAVIDASTARADAALS
jgi:hypothetical protein